MKSVFKTFVLAVTTLIAGSVAFAQVTTSSLGGVITDAQGESVIGAAVVATHTPSGTVYGAVTNSDGRYAIQGMRPGGPYVIEISGLGYQSVIFNDVTLQLGEQLALDAWMADDAERLKEAVVVADDSRFRRERNGASTNISSKMMAGVPTISRSMNDIMALTPQASFSTSGFAVGGGTYRGSAVTVDGAAFNNAFGIGQNLPAGGTPISLDALEQISVNVTPFDVRQSGFTGGAINAVTKSGTNIWHASVYDYYTSNKLNGAKVADKDVVNDMSLAHTIGATIGGPIVKNKLFFFVNAEYSFDTTAGSSSVARQSAADPWGSDVAANYPTVAQLDNIKSFLATKFNGYDPGRYQGYSLKTPDYKIMARLDWNISDYSRLNVRFSHTHNYYSSSPSSSMSPLGGTNTKLKSPDAVNIAFNRYSAGRQAASALFFESARYYQEQHFTSLAAELNTMLGSGNNMFRVAYSHQYEPRSYEGATFPTVDILDTANASGTDTHAIMTTFGVDPFTYGNLRDVNTVTATDEYSFIAGIHNVIAGAQFEWNRVKNGYMQGGAGWYVYDSWDSFVSDVTTGTAKASGFMITHANLDDPTAQLFPTFDYSQASLYAQDEMNISPYFKLTAGLRLEMPIISNPYDNLNKDFESIAKNNPNSSYAGLSTADLPGISVSVSPRVGFNWDVLKDRSLVVRGGTGLFTGRIPNVWLVSTMGNSNVLQYQYIANANTGNAMIPFSASRSDIIKNVWAANGGWKKQELAAPTGATILDKNLKMPTSWKSSLAVDCTLPLGIKASLEGIYSVNYNEIAVTTLNYAKTGTVSLPGEPEARSLWTSEGIVNKDNTSIGGYYLHNEKALHGSYYAVTLQLAKSFPWGLDLMAAYTRSGAKSVTDGNGDQVYEFANTVTLNGPNESCLGNASYVTPNRVIANAVYTISEGKVGATRLSVFYEGANIGYLDKYSYSRMSYLMNNVSGAGSANQLIYIPTAAELAAMPFADATNRDAYEAFIAGDKYLSRHRGEYSERNGVVAPWLNRVNVRIAQEFYFNVASRKNTLEIGLDIKNLGNLINSNWGIYKQMSSNVILSWDGANYTFTEPVWKNYNNLASTWQMLLSARWSF